MFDVARHRIYRNSLNNVSFVARCIFLAVFTIATPANKFCAGTIFKATVAMDFIFSNKTKQTLRKLFQKFI